MRPRSVWEPSFWEPAFGISTEDVEARIHRETGVILSVLLALAALFLCLCLCLANPT